MRGKYIVFQGQFSEVAVLIPNWTKHAEHAGNRKRIISAGFFDIQGKNVLVWGNSVSLGNIESRREDISLIKKSFKIENKEGEKNGKGRK